MALKTDKIKKTDNLPQENCTQINYGANIRALRRGLGMSQFKLAEAIKETQTKISTIENSASIDPKTLQKIADVFEVTISFIEKFNSYQQNTDKIMNFYDASRQSDFYDSSKQADFYDTSKQIDENDNSTNSITNTIEAIKLLTDKLTESYQHTIAEQKEFITFLKSELSECKSEIKELRSGK